MGGPAPKTARQITRSRGPDLGSKEQEAAMGGNGSHPGHRDGSTSGVASLRSVEGAGR
jgi:hypothetical protein